MPTPLRTPTLLLATVLAASGLVTPARSQVAAADHAAAESPLAKSVATAIATAIPPIYEKKKNWGATKNIVVGLRTEGKGLRTKIRRRKKAVKHGVWKHYQVQLIDPDETLRVTVDRLDPAGPGRMAFAMTIDAAVDAWGRAKTYKYGVHIIALEVVADARVHLQVAGEIALRLDATGETPGVIVEPVITTAAIRFDDLEIRRVSNAHGPVVRELGDGVRHFLHDAYDEPTLVAKLNRAIAKKQDRLRLQWSAPPLANWFAAEGSVAQTNAPQE